MFKTITVAALLLVVPFGTMAAEGIYNLVSLGVSPLRQESSTSFGLGIGVGGGYGFNKYVGVEAQLSIQGIASGNNVSQMPVPSVSVNAYIPFQENITFYGKAGKSETMLGYLSTDAQASYSGVTNFYGAGFEFSFADSKNTYRVGIDHYDLGLLPGAALSTNYINLASTTHF